MAEQTAIAWAHATFNPWWGCVEVSPACDHCYAREDAKRYGHAVWGKDAPRRFFGDKHWHEPLRWNLKAEDRGERRRVFCASMADVCEERDDDVGALMNAARVRLEGLIIATPHLDWLLLTKRPDALRRVFSPSLFLHPNVWPGVTVESEDYRWRIEKLVAFAETFPVAGPLWVSYEPALEHVDFRPYMPNALWNDIPSWKQPELAWVVVGSESRAKRAGRNPRYVEHARSVLSQCVTAGVAYFHKQMPVNGRVTDKLDDFPEDLRVREFPEVRR